MYFAAKRRSIHAQLLTTRCIALLQDSLGGTANTALIICCSPSLDNAAETLSSLRFGVRARGIVNSLVVNAAKIMPSATAESNAKELQVQHLLGMLSAAWF